MDYIPVMLNVSDRDVVIIGGGRAAFKKARNLMPHCSSITVIASRFSKLFAGLPVIRVRMHITGAAELDAFLGKQSVVVIATDDSKLNDLLENACMEKGVLYNRVDRKRSPFIFPASFDVDGIVVAVSTKGRSPSFSRFLSEILEHEVGRYADALPVLERLRTDLRIRDLDAKADFFYRLLADASFWQLVREGDRERAYELGVRMSAEVQGDVKQKHPAPKKRSRGKDF